MLGVVSALTAAKAKPDYGNGGAGIPAPPLRVTGAVDVEWRDS